MTKNERSGGCCFEVCADMVVADQTGRHRVYCDREQTACAAQFSQISPAASWTALTRRIQSGTSSSDLEEHRCSWWRVRDTSTARRMSSISAVFMLWSTWMRREHSRTSGLKAQPRTMDDITRLTWIWLSKQERRTLRVSWEGIQFPVTRIDRYVQTFGVPETRVAHAPHMRQVFQRTSAKILRTR